MKKVEWEEKFTDLFDYDRRGTKKLICVYTESILHYKTLLQSLNKDPRVVQLFNTDLSHIQQYLFTKLKIEPTRKVEVHHKNESRLIKITKITGMEAAPPSFSILYFEIHTTSSSYNLGHDVNAPVTEIRVRYQEEPETSLEGSEDAIIQSFCEYIQATDPDILFSSNQHSGSTTTLDYLFMRITELGLDLDFGRDKKTNKTNKIEGRVYLSNKSFHSDLDLVGLIERAQFGFLPLSSAARYGMNRLVDSRNCYELLQRGFVIQRSNNNHERIRTLDEIIARDKGGMIFSPRVGLQFNSQK